MRPKVSVIVPVYNVESYLKRCVDSIRGQTEQDIEIILVDDGSPDNCPEMCDQFAVEDRRVRVLHQENGGVSVARNLGIEQAAGEWIMFADPDDWLEPNAVEVMYNQAVQSGCDMVAASHYFNELDSAGRQVRARLEGLVEGTYHTDQDFGVLLQHLFMIRHHVLGLQAAWAKLYKRDIFLDGSCRFPLGMKMSEDIIFKLYALHQIKSLFILDVPVYHYQTGRTGSVTTGYRPDREKLCRRYIQEVREFFDRYELWEAFRMYFYLNVTESALAISYNESLGVGSFSDFLESVSSLRRFLEEPDHAKAVADIPLGLYEGGRKKVALWLLKRRMYKTFMLIRTLKAVVIHGFRKNPPTPGAGEFRQ